MTTIAVTYGYGAVNAAEIALGLGGIADLVFVVDDSEHTRPLVPLLADLGEVVRLDDGPNAAAARLATLGADAVVTYSDEMLPVTARLAERLGLPFHAVATVDSLTDKSLQRRRLREAGVEELRVEVIHDAADWPAALASVGLPAVLKPARGQGSRDTHLITDPQAGQRLLDGLLASCPTPPGRPAFVLEEYLVGRPSAPFGDYVSVETVCTANGYEHLVVSAKLPLLPPFRENGKIWPAPLPGNELHAIKSLASRALAALGIGIGITHTEVKLTAQGPRLIEVNGRMGGRTNDLCRNAFGFDLVELSGRLALGRSTWTAPPPPDRIHFQYLTPAPVQPFTLENVHGTRQVRELPHVTAYRPTVEPGSSLGPTVMTRPLDITTGAADTYEAVFDAVDQLRELLTYDLTLPTGPSHLTGADLASQPLPPPDHPCSGSRQLIHKS